jgi:hypothetical protein
MNKEQIMNERLKQLHNLNRAMQNANNADIKKMWLEKFYAVILNFAESIKSMQVSTPDPYNEHLNKTRGDKA